MASTSSSTPPTPKPTARSFATSSASSTSDVGHGWLIFGLPSAEAAFHPVDADAGQKHAGHQMLSSVVYLMCEDLEATVKALGARNIACTEIEKENWGIRTTVRLPSGGELGLYQPRHETALNL